MNHDEITAKKLDEVILLLKGAGEDSPGLIRRLNEHEEILVGKSGRGGIVRQVDIMWRVHVWFLCTASAGAGFLLKTGLEILIK